VDVTVPVVAATEGTYTNTAAVQSPGNTPVTDAEHVVVAPNTNPIPGPVSVA
jgi:hypothetical protein